MGRHAACASLGLCVGLDQQAGWWEGGRAKAKVVAGAAAQLDARCSQACKALEGLAAFARLLLAPVACAVRLCSDTAGRAPLSVSTLCQAGASHLYSLLFPSTALWLSSECHS
jgi:hypothetical protein